MKRTSCGAALLVLLMMVSACVTVPHTQRRALNLISVERELALGEEAYKSILSQSRLAESPRWLEILRRAGHRIASVSDMPSLKWEFNLIQSDQMNAFCLPGGKVAVYTGIMPIARNEAGIAAILGHEVAHAVARHAAERMSQALLLQLGLGLADISLKDNRYRDIILASLGVGSTVGVLLPYSRKHEREADEIGILYMAKAGYDPTEAVRVWERFSRAESTQRPEFLSTHPTAPSRIEALKQMLPRARYEYERASERRGLGEPL